MINSKEEIILISSGNKKIFYCDFNGERLLQTELANSSIFHHENLASFIDFNDEIVFFDSEDLNILYCD